MDQKHIGIILIIASISLASFVFILHQKNNAYADLYMADKGTCYLDDGTCLHKKDLFLYVLGYTMSAALFFFGIYVGFIDNTQKFIAEHQVKVSSALEKAKKHEKERDEFNAFLSGFGNDEQKILKSIKDQDGIKQSTLRYRTGLSKTTLSLYLKTFEEKNIISRKVDGKTKQVFLVKRF